ncbi:uncharacterized protein LOC142230995 [Haematobia irritans]|uniref:uncharacterized protein LOC142230995 n=1 Tax=Haematobia irritans TaxID=7368 RepID=UPI003F50517A
MVRILAKQRDGLRICHINAQSLNNKIDEFGYIFDNSDIDIVCVSETWFRSSTPDSLVGLKGYKVFRADRSSRGGGTAIYVRDYLRCNLCMKSGDGQPIEYVFVEIISSLSRILIGCVYRPNNSIDMTFFFDMLDSILIPYNDVVISGDFNSNIIVDSNITAPMLTLGLVPTNSSNPTHYTDTNSSLIDIFFVSEPTKVLLYDQISASCFSKHDLIFMSYRFQVRRKQTTYTFRDFRNINYVHLEALASCVNWDLMNGMVSVDDQLFFLQDNVKCLQDTLLPLKTKRVSSNSKPWFNDEARIAIRERDLAFSRWKRFRTSSLREEFRVLRKRANVGIRRAKTRYFYDRFSSALGSKHTWRIIREIGLGKDSGSDDLVDVDELNPWKHSKIIPLPKNCNEYRPISILSFLSKVLEKIMYKQVSDYLSDNSLLFEKQSGFRPNHSCITALTDVSEDIRCNMEKNEHIKKKAEKPQ